MANNTSEELPETSGYGLAYEEISLNEIIRLELEYQHGSVQDDVTKSKIKSNGKGYYHRCLVHNGEIQLTEEPSQPAAENLSDVFIHQYFLRYQTNDGHFKKRPPDDSTEMPLTKRQNIERMYRKERGYSYKRVDGNLVPARRVKSTCSCRLQCYARFPDDLRRKLLENLLNLSSDDQNRFLADHLLTEHDEMRKRMNRNYYFPGSSGHAKVCKTIFMNTFDISDKKIRCVADKKEHYQSILGEDSSNPNLIIPELDIKPEEGYSDDADQSVEEIDEFVQKSVGNNSAVAAPAGQIQEPCTCRLQCPEKAPYEVRQQLLQNFLLLSKPDKRRFLSNHMEVGPVGRSRKLHSRRSLSGHYYLPIDSQLVRVCRVMFMNTFFISGGELQSVATKKYRNSCL